MLSGSWRSFSAAVAQRRARDEPGDARAGGAAGRWKQVFQAASSESGLIIGGIVTRIERPRGDTHLRIARYRSRGRRAARPDLVPLT